MQIIFHIDLNAFFASAEVSRDPSLKGKPLVISGQSRRSIVTTASYEARQYGIHSAMPLFQAKKLCENLIVRSSDFELYRKLSNQFFEIIFQYSPILEVASIDECYVDMTEYIKHHHAQPVDLAKLIQNDVYRQLHLKCSVGIAPNKFLAKMASDMKKPMGITVLTRKNIKEKLWPLDISEMFGIGKKTCPKLKKVGINIIADIANYDNYSKLRTIAGKNALLLYRKANGIDNSKVNIEKNELKSVGNSTTLQYDSNDVEQLYDILNELANRVSYRAKRRNLISNSISITIKYSRFESVTRQTIIHHYINDYEAIISTAKFLFDQNYDGRPVRLLGVSLNNTVNAKNHLIQMNIFEETPVKKNNDVTQLIDQLNKDSHLSLKTASQLVHSSVQKKYIKNDE